MSTTGTVSKREEAMEKDSYERLNPAAYREVIEALKAVETAVLRGEMVAGQLPRVQRALAHAEGNA